MSTLVDRRSGGAARRRGADRQLVRSAATGSACTQAGGQATLEDVIGRAWQDLLEHRAVDCVICGAAMMPRYGASGHAPVGGRCQDCGASLR